MSVVVNKHPQLEHESFEHLKLGRHKKYKVVEALQLAEYVKPEVLLPQIPTEVDWVSGVASWPMYGNDRLGDCTCASAGHIIQALTTAAGSPKTPAESDVVSAYIPGTGTDDSGRAEPDVLNYWQNEGIGGDKIEGWVAVDFNNLDLVKAAIFLFGAAYAGIDLPLSAQSQEVWDAVAGDPAQIKPGSWGGHAVPYEAYDDKGFVCITWGHPLRLTYNFHNAYTDEVYAPLSPDFINSQGKTPQGFDIEQLRADLVAVKIR